MEKGEMDNAVTKLEEEATTNHNPNDVVFIDLPAPLGWSKKFTPKEDGTPQRNEIVFISPTGEEIQSKRQLGQYLKPHPNEPSAAEFDWGSGDSPRRSSRLSSIPKATDTPESGSWRKKQKRSNSKKGGERKEVANEEGGTEEDEAPTDKPETNKDEEISPDDNKAEEKSELGNGEEETADIVLLENNTAMEVHTIESIIEPGKEACDAQVAPLYSEDGVHEATPENIGMEIDELGVDQVGLEKKGEEIMPDDNKPVEKSGLGNDEGTAEVVLPGNNTMMEINAVENRIQPEKEVSAEAAPLHSEDGVKEANHGNLGVENNETGVEQEGLEKKIVSAGNNGTGKNQKAGEQTESRPLDSDNKTPETSAATSLIKC